MLQVRVQAKEMMQVKAGISSYHSSQTDNVHSCLARCIVDIDLVYRSYLAHGITCKGSKEKGHCIGLDLQGPQRTGENPGHYMGGLELQRTQ